MRYFWRILLLAVTVVILTTSVGLAAKFENKDTAKNRKDNTFGTQPDEGRQKETSVTTDEDGNTVIRSKPDKREQEDWYDKIIITVDPEVKIEDK